LYLTIEAPGYVERIAKPLIGIKTQQQIQFGSLNSTLMMCLALLHILVFSGLNGER